MACAVGEEVKLEDITDGSFHVVGDERVSCTLGASIDANCLRDRLGDESRGNGNGLETHFVDGGSGYLEVGYALGQLSLVMKREELSLFLLQLKLTTRTRLSARRASFLPMSLAYLPWSDRANYMTERSHWGFVAILLAWKDPKSDWGVSRK